MSRVLTPQDENFPQWFQDVVARAKLADNGPVRGTMVIRPNGYAIWEHLQQELDRRFRRAGVRNAYFPMFIPHSFLEKEAEHVEGFSPELAIVTKGGGKELDEPIVVRPTSETVINNSFSRWVQSYRDLPLLVNQWANVVRWEMRPRLFLRTSEFLWQEGHTCHVDREEARAFAQRIATSAYYEVMGELMAIPVRIGAKTDRERFAGAIHTYTLEGMMRDGKALQMGTSHELGQNFAKAFDTMYLSEHGVREHVWQTSWGASTRLLGALIMTHGDDNGLRLPPLIAPDQVVIVQVKAADEVASAARRLYDELEAAGVRVRLDEDTKTSFGRRVVDWELAGVPVRVEIGPRDLAEGKVTLARRDSGEKTLVELGQVADTSAKLLVEIQRSLADEALRRREERTVDVTTLAEAAEAGQTGWARVPYEAVREAEATGPLGVVASVHALHQHANPRRGEVQQDRGGDRAQAEHAEVGQFGLVAVELGHQDADAVARGAREEPQAHDLRGERSRGQLRRRRQPHRRQHQLTDRQQHVGPDQPQRADLAVRVEVGRQRQQHERQPGQQHRAGELARRARLPRAEPGPQHHEHRGRGAQSLLLRHRLRTAADAGCALAVATARPGSVSTANLRRAGFRTQRRTTWTKA
nr:proline--tRNA ligase [Allokutzneria sp. NRRL B-24872]